MDCGFIACNFVFSFSRKTGSFKISFVEDVNSMVRASLENNLNYTTTNAIDFTVNWWLLIIYAYSATSYHLQLTTFSLLFYTPIIFLILITNFHVYRLAVLGKNQHLWATWHLLNCFHLRLHLWTFYWIRYICWFDLPTQRRLFLTLCY